MKRYINVIKTDTDLDSFEASMEEYEKGEWIKRKDLRDMSYGDFYLLQCELLHEKNKESINGR